MTDAALYRLMAWFSPAYPTGGFSFSHGLEFAVEAGLVTDAAALAGWVEAVLLHGGGHADGVLLAAAHRAALAADPAPLAEVAALAAAFRGTAELALETAVQGDAFVLATRAAWPCTALDRLAAIRPDTIALPVAVGVAAAGHGIALDLVLPAYLQALAANLVSAGLRLIPLGQTAGQRTLAALEETVAGAAALARATPLDALGTAAPMIDWTSMRHETQYTRLFRS